MGCSSSSSVLYSNPEFEFRYGNVKILRQGFKNLLRAINDANLAFLKSPNCLQCVADGFVSVSAALNHGGGGGVGSIDSHCPDRRMDPEQNDYANGGRTCLNREVAEDTFTSAQYFSNAMRRVREEDYVTYRTSVEEEILQRLRSSLAAAEGAASKGCTTQASLLRYARLNQEVEEMETKCTRKGKSPEAEKGYSAMKDKQSFAEGAYKTDLAIFNEQYEALMMASQEVIIGSMDRYLDLTVAYDDRFMSVIDTTGTSSRMKSNSKRRLNCEPIRG